VASACTGCDSHGKAAEKINRFRHFALSLSLVNVSVIVVTRAKQEPNDAIHHAGSSNTSKTGCGAHYTFGVGGPCERYEPKGGYLCSKYATGGGFGWDEMVPGSPLFPIGLQVSWFFSLV
jgi:hypothetical protein